jgi:hypothetical protein
VTFVDNYEPITIIADTGYYLTRNDSSLHPWYAKVLRLPGRRDGGCFANRSGPARRRTCPTITPANPSLPGPASWHVRKVFDIPISSETGNKRLSQASSGRRNALALSIPSGVLPSGLYSSHCAELRNPHVKSSPLDKCRIRVVGQPQIAVGIVCDRYGVVVVGARVPVLREREYRRDTAASGSVASLPLFFRGILSRPTFWAEHLIRCVLMDAACGPTSQCAMDGTPSHIGAGDE